MNRDVWDIGEKTIDCISSVTLCFASDNPNRDSIECEIKKS